MKRYAPWSVLLCALALQLSSACGMGTHNSRPQNVAVAAAPAGSIQIHRVHIQRPAHFAR
jgi:hypothetical protein